MIHDTRLIPLTTAAHVGKGIRSDFGNARGHWEGDTLVVETTNFLGRSAYRNANADRLTIVERFTPVGPKTVRWTVTIDDTHHVDEAVDVFAAADIESVGTDDAERVP